MRKTAIYMIALLTAAFAIGTILSRTDDSGVVPSPWGINPYENSEDTISTSPQTTSDTLTEEQPYDSVKINRELLEATDEAKRETLHTNE